MRLIPLYEKKQRGCQYCLQMQYVKHEGKYRTACTLEECPYQVLEKYKSYEEFMASEDGKILVTEFFTTVPDCYELAKCEHTPMGIYKDKGDFKMHL